MKIVLTAIMIGVLLAGCRAASSPQQDHMIVWDANGCAYSVEHWSGDSFSVSRQPTIDTSTDCKEK